MNIAINKFEEWLSNKNLKERTIENYLYYFNKFTHEVFNQETISRFLSEKSNRNSIARSFLINLQHFLRVNYKELGLSEKQRMDISETEMPKITGRTKQSLVKPLPYDQIFMLERALDSEKLKLQLLITYFCGLRLGELLKIDILSFNWGEWKKDMSKMGECRVYGKGDKEGIALVPSVLMKRIAQYIKGRKFNSVNSRLFIRDGEDMNIKNRARTWQNKLSLSGVKCGITKLDAEGKKIKGTVVHPHRLRHSYADYLIKVKHMNIRQVQELLRHSSIQSTQIYTSIDKEDLKRELQKEDD